MTFFVDEEKGEEIGGTTSSRAKSFGGECAFVFFLLKKRVFFFEAPTSYK